MSPAVAQRLLELNRAFYDRFAEEFSATRRTIPRGIERAVDHLAGRRRWLDVACGDGRVGRFLQSAAGRSMDVPPPRLYLGVDSSGAMLEIARTSEAQRLGDDPHSARGPALAFCQADLTDPAWPSLTAIRTTAPFDAIICFAALFHVPGAALRQQIMEQFRTLIAENGRLALSVWQILHHESLRAKVVPWNEAGLEETQVDPGDLLVSWKHGGNGMRYVHHFAPEELDALCRDTGWTIVDAYESDGRSGDLSTFRILAPVPHP